MNHCETQEAFVAEKEILRGWKEITHYVGLGRKAILRAGYPVRYEASPGVRRPSVFAIRTELLEHALRGNHVSSRGVA